jgi:hypothetical protein
MSGEPDPRHASLLVHVDGDLDLPIDVLDSEMRLALQGYSNEPLSVMPGAYLVSATLPGGATAMKLVGVGAGDNLTVNLPVRHEFSRTAGPASLGRLTGLDEPVRTVAEALDLDMTTPRFWRMDNLENALEDPNPVVEASPSEGGRRIFRVTVPGPGVYYAQVDTADGAQLNVALPATATLSSTCELLLQLESGNILLGAFPAGLLGGCCSVADSSVTC